MRETKERYLIDETGRASAIVLDIKTYRRLLRRLENLEDAVELDEAQRSAKSFRSYEKIRAELIKAGRL